ncbi:MAG TPA: nucleoside triphosphate pyrophosphohydrolase [Ktedonobacteraceae bacterium]|nr:nucleoside triphosphate pyrophosphohydrolase [Ktedonobacteraceae bacterium]
MRKEYHKLVRDLIPEHIRMHGDACIIDTMSEEDYRQALREKLVEEAQEACEADVSQLAKELADLYEVIDTLMAVYDISLEQVRAIQERKRREVGGFEQRIRLLWTE